MEDINIMTLLTPKAGVAYITSNMSVRQGLEKLRTHSYQAIPVLNEDGTYYGVVSEGDFLRTILKDNVINIYQLEAKNVREIISRQVPSCKIDTTYDELLSLIVNFNFVPIVDDRNIFMGIITRKSVLDNLKK